MNTTRFKIVIWILAVATVIALTAFVTFHISPWPSALLIRRAMDSGGIKLENALEKHVPAGIAEQLNEHYDPSDGHLTLDVFSPVGAEGPRGQLPAIVWVHGGAFVSGSKDQIRNYLKILASKGLVAVGIEYSLAPGQRYPTPINQVNASLAYLGRNAARLHIDTSSLFLAGDSAGAQIAAQLANVITSPSYAREMGIVPSINPVQLRGIVLYCGIYDAEQLNFEGSFGSFLKIVTWSYFGTTDLRNDPQIHQFSILRHLTAAFPRMFISAGNADPLASQSYLLAKSAAQLDIPVQSLFFPNDYKPPLSHEYQFDLDLEAGQEALNQSVRFLAQAQQIK